MSRRVELEKIIIGTLMESDGERNYFDDCRCAISQEMFSDEVCRRLYGYISQMNQDGMPDTRPCSILEVYGEQVKDIAVDMLEICTDYSFIHKKMEFNERRYLATIVTGHPFRRTDVEFSDYVTQFLKLVYDGEKTRYKRAEDAAA